MNGTHQEGRTYDVTTADHSGETTACETPAHKQVLFTLVPEVYAWLEPTQGVCQQPSRLFLSVKDRLSRKKIRGRHFGFKVEVSGRILTLAQVDRRCQRRKLIVVECNSIQPNSLILESPPCHYFCHIITRLCCVFFVHVVFGHWL